MDVDVCLSWDACSLMCSWICSMVVSSIGDVCLYSQLQLLMLRFV